MSAVLQAQIDDLEYRVAELEDMLGVTWLAPEEFGLTPAESRVLGCLLKHPQASRAKLSRASAKPGTVLDHRSDKIVDIYVCRMRQKLGRYGFEIVTLREFGYQLKGASVARLRDWTPASPWLETVA